MRHKARPRRWNSAPKPPVGRCPKTGKLSFPTKAKARKALTHFRKVAEGPAKRIYSCEFCGDWRLTSQRRKEAA